MVRNLHGFSKRQDSMYKNKKGGFHNSSKYKVKDDKQKRTGLRGESQDSLAETYKALKAVFNIPSTLPRVRERLARKVLDSKDASLVDSNGKTLLMLACIDNKLDIVNFLLDTYPRKIDMGKVDLKGNSALHYASVQGRPALVQRVSTAMAKRSIPTGMKNKEGLTAADLALKHGNAYAADIIIRDMSSSRLELMLSEGRSSRSQASDSRAVSISEGITGFDEAFFSEPLSRETSFTLPLIRIPEKSTNEEERELDSPAPKPHFETNMNSKIICSYLLELCAVQESSTYRRGFQQKWISVIDEKTIPNITIKDSLSSENCGTPSPSAAQINTRRLSAKIEDASGGASESIFQSPKTRLKVKLPKL
eukprot:gene9618-17377_t